MKESLQVSISCGKAEITRLLLSAISADSKSLWEFATKHACVCGQTEIVEIILQRRSGPTEFELSEDELHDCLNSVAEHGHWRIITLIDIAAGEGGDGVISELLSNHNDKSTAISRHLPLGPAFFTAVGFGSAAVVHLLASKIPSALGYREGEDGLHMTALHWAAVHDSAESIGVILDFGINIDSVDDQQATPLLLACHLGNVNASKTLLKRGADPDHIAKKSSRFRAYMLRHKKALLLLCECFLTTGPVKQNALEPSQHDRYIQTVQTLLDLGVNVNIAREGGVTVLHLAIEENWNKDLVLALLRAGADIDKRDEDEKSRLLFGTAFERNVRRMQQLLDAGYDTTEKDEWGRTAYDVSKSPEVRALLSPSRETLGITEEGNQVSAVHATTFAN
ncbi:ankyrin repeat-containing domain protein [Xylariaceae sp. FL1272]|nr:ankyrin repeat-containing domain protein [Xylariaceae sp. FL1272]